MTAHCATRSARYRVVVFVVARNREYAALKKFAQVMHFDGVPGLELPDIDITGIATAYGIPATQVTSLAQLTTAVKGAPAGDGPRLIEVPSSACPAPEDHRHRSPGSLSSRRQVGSNDPQGVYLLGGGLGPLARAYGFSADPYPGSRGRHARRREQDRLPKSDTAAPRIGQNGPAQADIAARQRADLRGAEGIRTPDPLDANRAYSEKGGLILDV